MCSGLPGVVMVGYRQWFQAGVVDTNVVSAVVEPAPRVEAVPSVQLEQISPRSGHVSLRALFTRRRSTAAARVLINSCLRHRDACPRPTCVCRAFE
jgi:hypothetical protein